MAVQDNNRGNRSTTVLPAGNVMSMNSGLNNVSGGQLKEQVSCGNDYSLKVRKPYTITKQRERWTEEEHKKFLEALKLYGRAWRQIEEHIGTKTAVQIRSHAQKFFSKVVREGSRYASAAEPIEIPPPRPKRKPMHPYPRKMVHPLNKELSIPAQQLMLSSSRNFSILEQENQSPTSVLSAVGSDVIGSSDSNTSNRSSSPVSCVDGSHPSDFTICEPNSTSEDNGSASLAPPTAEAHNEQSVKVKKLELFPEENVSSEEGFVKETSTRSVKLFGRTVLVTECPIPSTPVAVGNSDMDTDDVKFAQPQLCNFMAAELQPRNGEYNLTNYLPQGPPGTLYDLQIRKETSNATEAGLAAPLPWCSFYKNLSFPSIPFHKLEPTNEPLDSNGEELQDKDVQKEGSWTGSNSGPVNEDGETESRQVSSQLKEHYPPVPELKQCEKRTTSSKFMQGFVPYRKRRAERDGPSSTVTGEEREDQRIRLSL